MYCLRFFLTYLYTQNFIFGWKNYNYYTIDFEQSYGRIVTEDSGKDQLSLAMKQ